MSADAVANSSEELLIEYKENNGRKIAVVTLNSESTLNSLTLTMISRLWENLNAWEKDKQMAAIFLQGAGEKAFCAGGDIQKLYQSMTEAGPGKATNYAESFFKAEYSLDYKIHQYSKPIILWGHGFVMGGGLGLMNGACCRVVTESSKLAMPEITIGLYPDVGATYFLNQMPKGVGLYLALTGTRLRAPDALALNLADVYLQNEQKALLLQNLAEASWTDSPLENREIVKSLLNDLSKGLSPGDSELKENMPFIEASYQHGKVVEVAKFWKETLAASPNKWIRTGLETFFRGSPTSAHVIFEQIKRGEKMNLRDAFMSEAALTVQFALHNDFREGVRALLIDKDNKPNWNPKTLEEVSSKLIQEHFENPWGNQNNPLGDVLPPN